MTVAGIAIHVCEEAARGGHLEVLQRCRGNGCQWDRMTCRVTDLWGHPELLRWCRANGCPRDELTCMYGSCSRGTSRVATGVPSQGISLGPRYMCKGRCNGPPRSGAVVQGERLPLGALHIHRGRSSGSSQNAQVVSRERTAARGTGSRASRLPTRVIWRCESGARPKDPQLQCHRHMVRCDHLSPP